MTPEFFSVLFLILFFIIFLLFLTLSVQHERPHWGSLQRSPRPPSWFQGGRFAAGGEWREGEGRTNEGKTKGERGREGKGKGEEKREVGE